MELYIAEQVNPVFECLDILVRHYSKRNYSALKKEIKTRLDIEVPEIEKLLDDLQSVADQVAKGVRKSDEIVAYLFHPLGGQDSTPAEAILQFYGDFSERELIKIQNGVLCAFKQDPLNFLNTTLDNYNLLYAGPGKKSLKERGLLELMESCSLPDQDKWRLLAFYHDFEAYLDRFIDVLGKAIQAFEPFIPSLSVWTEPFYKRFLNEINNETLYRYMAEKIHIILPETDSIFIQPSLFGCNRLQYLASTEPGRRSNMLWGMHFEAIFLNRLKHNSSAYMCNNMRLLGDKSKFDILKLLAGRRYYSGELAKELNLSTSTIAYHMQALLNARFVTVDKRGYRTYYELNKDAICVFLDQIRNHIIPG